MRQLRHMATGKPIMATSKHISWPPAHD